MGVGWEPMALWRLSVWCIGVVQNAAGSKRPPVPMPIDTPRPSTECTKSSGLLGLKEKHIEQAI